MPPDPACKPRRGGGTMPKHTALVFKAVTLRCQLVVSTMNDLERELAELMIRELNLEDIQVAAVSGDTVLYGEGFGLDSIDILEIALLISKKYGFELRSDNPDNKTIFSTLGALAAYVAEHRIR